MIACIDTPVAPIGWPFAFSPPDGLTGSRPSFAVQPSSTARAPWPGAVSPIASYSSSSAMVKQSCDSTNDRSSSLTSAASQRAPPRLRRALERVMSRLLIGRKSLTCTAALNRTALPIARAVSSSVITSAAAPSDTSEQSVRFSGGAT